MYRFYQLIICTLVFIVFSNSLIYSQLPNDLIEIENPNLRYIEHLIKIKVDSIRKKNNLPQFINDSILYLASRNHARFLSRAQDLTHYQPKSRRKRTYHERAIQFGAEDYYVSENLAKVKFSELVSEHNSTLTYSQIADRIINKWLASEGSMANILAASHAIIGLASWFDSDLLELRVASSFAAVTSRYRPHHNRYLFPYENLDANIFKHYSFEKPERRYEWGISPKPSRRDVDNLRSISRRVNTLGLVTNKDSIYVVFNNARRMESLFENRTDGLAVEIVPHSYYKCTSIDRKTIRRDEDFTIKGVLLEPVYRDYLLENIADQKRKPRFDLKLLGILPEKYRNESYSLNLVMLKRNRIADIVTFNNTPSKVFDLAVSVSPAHDSIPKADYYIPALRRDTLQLRVYFDQNKIDVLPIIGDSIRGWVRDRRVDRAAVYAYASVEGTERINRALSEGRANEMIVFFSPTDGRQVPTTKVSRENWFDFFREIEESRYDFLTQLDREQVRNYVNHKINSRKMEPILARQRFADLKIFGYRIINDLSIDELAISEYNNLFERLKVECSSQPAPCRVHESLTQRMELIQLYLFNRNAMGRVSWHSVNTLPINFYGGEFDIHAEPLAKLYYNKNRYTLISRGDYLTPADSLTILKELNRFPFPDPIVTYNYFASLIRNTENRAYEPFYQQRTLNELQQLIKRLESVSFDPSILNQLKLYYHFKKVEQEFFINRYGDFDRVLKPSLDFIYSYYNQNPPTLKLAMDLSMFFSAFQRYDEAMSVIEPHAFAELPNKELLALYLKYYYANSRVKQNTDFYQFLKDAGDIYAPMEWCNLFEGENPISIQVLDHEPLFIMYCKMCNDLN